MTKRTDLFSDLIIADDIGEYVPSPELIPIKTKLGFIITKTDRHEDYSVWYKGRVIAQGGFPLMEKVFQERTK
ncbi:hypothetical protein GOC13_24580 [Sinorhizobium meliloti]|nr:hypothetical protein [Sinorhizobium meliloti]